MDSKEYYQKNRERILEYQNAYSKRSENKKRARVYQKGYRQNPKNKQRAKEYRQEYCKQSKVKEKQIAYTKKYYSKSEVKQRLEKYRRLPRVKNMKNEYSKKYYQSHKEYWRMSARKPKRIAWKKQYQKKYMPGYMKKRCEQDELFKLGILLRVGISGSLSKVGIKKNQRRWESLLGYSVEELKVHLESQFTPEMNWGNHGSYWHIDHCVPVSWFESEKALLQSGWALGNLQPLERSANLRKHNGYASRGGQTLLVDRKDFEGVI